MNWFRSINGVILISFLALLSLLFRSYMDTAYILPGDYSEFGITFSFFWFFGYTAILGGWIWALVAAERGSRGGLVVMLVYSAIVALGFGVISLVVFISHPEEIIIYGANFIFGSLAFASIYFRLKNDD